MTKFDFCIGLCDRININLNFSFDSWMDDMLNVQKTPFMKMLTLIH